MIEANNNPYNVRNGVSSTHSLYFSGDSCWVDLGTNIFSHSFKRNPTVTPLAIKGFPIIDIRKSDNHLLFTLKIFDDDGTEVLRIEDNELQYSIAPWDIEFVGTNLKIRRGPRRIAVEIDLRPPAGIKISRGIFAHDGAKVTVQPECIFEESLKNRLSRNQCWDNKNGIGFEFGNAPHHFRGAAFAIGIA